MTHICVANPSSSLIGLGGDLQNSVRPRWVLIGPLGTNFSEISNIFTEENAFENVVWKMTTNLSRPQCVKLVQSDLMIWSPCLYYVFYRTSLRKFWQDYIMSETPNWVILEDVIRKQKRNVEKPWWRHQMETFSILQAFCEGNQPATGRFPSQKPVTNVWANNRNPVIWDAIALIMSSL